MKRTRRQPGIIISVASESPDRPVRTLVFSAGLLNTLKIGLAVALLLAGTGIVAGLTRSFRLAEQREALAQALSDAEARFTASETRLGEVNLATEELLSELGRVGARVRELQTFAGLPPDVEVEAISSANVADVATRFALGGVSGAALAGASADALGVGLGDLVAIAHSDLADLEARISDVHDTVAHNLALEASTPSIWPVSGWISSYFGWRRSPIDGRTLMHKGVDIVAPYRTPVAATAPGTVVTAGWSSTGYGYHVVVDHGFGFRTLYGHLSEVAVSVGDDVALGATVGLLGSTGYSTGPHLHYEVVRQGVAVDPATYLAE